MQLESSLVLNKFNILINSFIDNKIGISDNFLPDSLALQLKENLIGLMEDDKFRLAGTGNADVVMHKTSLRSDKIYWLDRLHNNPSENDFFDLIDTFINYLNKTCYTGITGYEFHYTLYEPGSFYKKHIDQFRNNESRKYSIIMYLNNGWQEDDGGKLCIYHSDHLQFISPENGKIVFFKSNEIEHEVMIANKPRMSITGWLKVN
ncbi:MAG: 2OG-Fe(II) oxygenase [Chitinophagaceae bacterium]